MPLRLFLAFLKKPEHNCGGETEVKEYMKVFFRSLAASAVLVSLTLHGVSAAETSSEKNESLSGVFPSSAEVAAEFFGSLKHDSVISDFEQTRFMAESERTLKSTGSMLFSSSEGLCWKMLTPFRRAWLFDDNGVTEFQADGSSKSVSGDQNGMFNSILLAVLNSGVNGRSREVTDSFDVVSGGRGEDGISVIYLQPKDRQIAGVIYRIKLERKHDMLSGITIMEHGNSYTGMVFSGQQSDSPKAAGIKDFCSFR